MRLPAVLTPASERPELRTSALAHEGRWTGGMQPRRFGGAAENLVIEGRDKGVRPWPDSQDSRTASALGPGHNDAIRQGREASGEARQIPGQASRDHRAPTHSPAARSEA